MSKCNGVTWSFHGLDLVECAYPENHDGKHRNVSPFSIEWDDIESNKVKEQYLTFGRASKDTILPLKQTNSYIIASAMNLNKDFASGCLKGQSDQRDLDFEVIEQLMKTINKSMAKTLS